MSFASTRRLLLTGLAAAAASPALGQTCSKTPLKIPPATWTEQKAFPDGPLAQGLLGSRFKAPGADFTWPATPLFGASGPLTPAAWLGRTVLVSLWAEWCGPCMVELPALARLTARYGNKTLTVVPILTGSQALKTLADAQSVLIRRKAVGLQTLVDGSESGKALMESLALQSETTVERDGCWVRRKNSSLPCVLLIDPRGKLRGRSLGLPSTKAGGNIWDEPEGEAFFRLLAGGALA